MKTDKIDCVMLNDEKPNHPTESYNHLPCLVLTFGPGVVRYINCSDLKLENEDVIFREMDSLGALRSVAWPAKIVLEKDVCGDGQEYLAEWGNWEIEFEFFDFDRLLTDVDPNKQMKLLVAIVGEYLRDTFPSEAYRLFSVYLDLSESSFEEFRKSWVSDVWGNEDLTNSFLGDEKHAVLIGSQTGVFRVTEYVRSRLKDITVHNAKIIEEKIELQNEQEAKDHQQLLEISKYEIFVYLMEDTRNGRIKIGKSKTPERREKTLQSEVPTTELRLAVPCDSSMESTLHQEYASDRKRGEWFKLDAKSTMEIVTTLLKEGDAQRSIKDDTWLANLLITSNY